MKKSIQERLEALQKQREVAVTKMQTIFENAAEEERSFDGDEQKEFDAAKADQALLFGFDDRGQLVALGDHGLLEGNGVLADLLGAPLNLDALGLEGHRGAVRLVATGLVGNGGDVGVLGRQLLDFGLDGIEAQGGDGALGGRQGGDLGVGHVLCSFVIRSCRAARNRRSTAP